MLLKPAIVHYLSVMHFDAIFRYTLVYGTLKAVIFDPELFTRTLRDPPHHIIIYASAVSRSKIFTLANDESKDVSAMMGKYSDFI